MRTWLVHPIRTVSEITDYREDHRGIPFIIMIFMVCARNSIWLIITIAIVSPGYFFFHNIFIRLFSIIGLEFMYIVWNIFAIPRLDFFLPLGFRVWKWLITQH